MVDIMPKPVLSWEMNIVDHITEIRYANPTIGGIYYAIVFGNNIPDLTIEKYNT
jgi:hypothetical protein